MTYREIISKVNAFNEIAKEIGQPKVKLYARIDGHRELIESPRDFRAYLKDTYFDWSEKPMLACDDYGFNKETFVTCVDPYGYQCESTVEFWTVED